MRSTEMMFLGVLSLVVFLLTLSMAQPDKTDGGVQLGLRKCDKDAVEQEVCDNTGDSAEPVGLCLPYDHPHTLANIARISGSGGSAVKRAPPSQASDSHPGQNSWLICVPPIPCGTCFPGMMSGMWVLTDVNQSTFPATASLTCPDGFSIDGGVTIQCRLNGTWEESSSSCSLAYCGEPPMISNGNWTSTGNMSTGDVARLVCDAGYLDGSCSFTVCQADANWTDATASCSPIDCGPPPPISDGEYIGANTTYLSVVMISCDDKFKANVTNATITCDADGSWSGPVETCIRVECETGWDEVGDSCYQIASGQMTFDDAVAYCVGLGAELVTIETSAENALLKSYAQTNSVTNWWIGITDIDTEDTWVYHHSGDTVTFTNWKPSQEPNNCCGGEDCGSMWWSNTWWNDYGCSRNQRVICEMSL